MFLLMPYHVKKCVTISAVHPLLKHIIEKLLALLPTDSCFVKEIKTVISDKNCKHSRYILKELSDLLGVSSSLDP